MLHSCVFDVVNSISQSLFLLTRHYPPKSKGANVKPLLWAWSCRGVAVGDCRCGIASCKEYKVTQIADEKVVT